MSPRAHARTRLFSFSLIRTPFSGLFCVTGLGLIPWRVTDTYRRCFSTELPVRDADGRALGVYKIWRYKRRTRLLRKQHGLPELFDPDDLPDPIYDPNYVHVLTEEEQADLHYREHPTPLGRSFSRSLSRPLRLQSSRSS